MYGVSFARYLLCRIETWLGVRFGFRGIGSDEGSGFHGVEGRSVVESPVSQWVRSSAPSGDKPRLPGGATHYELEE